VRPEPTRELADRPAGHVQAIEVVPRDIRVGDQTQRERQIVHPLDDQRLPVGRGGRRSSAQHRRDHPARPGRGIEVDVGWRLIVVGAVKDQRAVGQEPRARTFAAGRGRLPGEARRHGERPQLGVLGLQRVTVGDRSLPIVVEAGAKDSDVAAADRLGGGPIDAARDAGVGIAVRELADLERAVAVLDVAQKARAVEVGGRPLRVGVGDRRDLIEAEQPALQERDPQVHVVEAAAQAPGGRLARLHEDRHPLDEPGRLRQVGGVGPAEDGVDRQRTDAEHRVEVDDVRELVGDEQLHVVVEVVQLVERVGGDAVGVDEVVGDGAGRAVGLVGDVAEDDRHPAARLPVEIAGIEAVGALGEVGDPLGELGLVAIEVDVEVRRLQREPAPPRQWPVVQRLAGLDDGIGAGAGRPQHERRPKRHQEVAGPGARWHRARL
jgi:hypothetical protein